MQTETALSLFFPESVLDLQNGSTHYLLSGPEDGELVICFHGFSLSYLMWEGLRQKLNAKGYQVLAFDFYGSGFSSCIPSEKSYNMELLLDQASELLERLGFGGDKQKFHLVGYSLGGGVAAAFAKRYRRQVQSLSLMAPIGLGLPSFSSRSVARSSQVISGIIHHALISNLVHTSTKFVSNRLVSLCGFGSAPSSSDMLNMLQSKTGSVTKMLMQVHMGLKSELYLYDRDPQAFKARVKSCHQLLLQDLSQDVYKEIGQKDDAVPSQFLWGEQDQVIPMNSDLKEKISNLLPNAQLTVVKDVGHSFVVESAPLLFHKVTQFVGENSSPETKEKQAAAGILPESDEDLVLDPASSFLWDIQIIIYKQTSRLIRKKVMPLIPLQYSM